LLCTVLFVSISQVTGCEDRLRNDLDCVRWGVKLYLNSNSLVCQLHASPVIILGDKIAVNSHKRRRSLVQKITETDASY